jgi:hypothetical protein
MVPVFCHCERSVAIPMAKFQIPKPLPFVIGILGFIWHLSFVLDIVWRLGFGAWDLEFPLSALIPLRI